MKKVKLFSFALITMFLFSCGNKEVKSNSEEEKENTQVVETEPEVKDVVIEDITLSFTKAKDPCFGNNPDYLHIKGGKPFEDEATPYKVEAQNTKQGSVSFGKFTKAEDGIYTIDIPSTTNLADDEVKIKIIVTDANGTEKTIEYTIPHCL
jgi:hypothetical protein